ncbi:MAG: hydroxymethylbilane synthase [Gemmataceae bacterium]
MLRIGTRGSPLALWQANHVADLLRRAVPDEAIELVIIQTVGDQVRDVPLAQIGGDGVFTKAIQDAVVEGRVNVAVHSLKDLPTIPVPGLVLAAVPPRGPVRDVFVSAKYLGFDELPKGATVATSSLRRRAQTLNRRPDLKLIDIRGNVETRLRKLEAGEADATLLAEAGLVRLGLGSRVTQALDWMLPAVGQGALGLECRSDDARTRGFLARLDDEATHAAALAERSLLRQLGGGCQVPLGVRSIRAGAVLRLTGLVLSGDGRNRIEEQGEGDARDPEGVGQALAEKMLARGAGAFLPRQ